MHPTPEVVLGIDLGTTNSVAAAVRGGKVEVVPDYQGRRLHPSVVGFLPNNAVVVGHRARERRRVDPAQTICSAKRLIGQSIHDPGVSLAASYLPYEVKEGANQQPTIVVGERTYTVPQVSSFVLKYLKRCAEDYFGVPINKAVITVPANFTDSRRQATKRAGELAGLEVLRILNEPTAAALAYGLGKKLQGSFAVFDLGGGTFDATVLRIQDRVYEVLATGGDSFLGGDDFDRALADKLAADAMHTKNIDVRANQNAWTTLLIASETIRCQLSSNPAVAGTIHDLALGPDGEPVALDFELTRADIETLIEPYVTSSIEACRQVIQSAGLEPSELTEIILVGGATRSPLIREQLTERFGRAPLCSINPDEAVAHGAAIHAAELTTSRSHPREFRSLLLDVCPRALGIAVAGGYNETIIERNTTIPVECTRSFVTSKNQQSRVDIEVSQGEDKMFTNNERLGVLTLDELPARPRGDVRIEVTFTVDTNGILGVRALDTKTRRATHASMRVIGAPEKTP